VNSFFAAVQFLTIFSWPRRPERSAEEIGGSAMFFPVVGLLLGIVLGLLDRALEPVTTPGLSSVLLVATLAWLTRGLHLDGLGDTFDGLGAGGDRERMLCIMNDSRIGAFGLIAIVVVLLMKIHALESMDSQRWRALLAAPILGRSAMVLLAYRSRPAKTGLGAAFIEHLTGRHLAIATTIAAILVGGLLGIAGIGLLLAGALFAFGSQRYFHHRLGGVTGDTCGAVGELTEAGVWVCLALGIR
jgi:adenosylcobinamide-GDP ribazoletransferase